MKRSIITIISHLVVVFAMSFEAFAGNELDVVMLPGERWWGGLNDMTNRKVVNPAPMPYSESTQIALNFEEFNYSNCVVPFFVSNKGRYVWSDGPFKVSFSGGKIHFEGDNPIEMVQAGKTLKDAFTGASASHFAPTGTIPPEKFIIAPQYNTWIELVYNQNQKDILNYAHSIVNNGFPSGGILMIDDNWQKYYGNFEFKPDKFPDPKSMVEELHSLGFKVMLWICPFVSPDSPEYRMLAKKGWLVKDATGKKAAVVTWWNGRSAVIDLSNPAARAYLKEKLLDMQNLYGIDGFKFDAGDPSSYLKNDVIVSDGFSYGIRHTELWAKLGLEFPYNEFRACWKMAGQPLVIRLQDKPYSWSGVGELLPCMINSSMLGHIYVCPDMVGGGDFATFINVDPKEIDQELIVRSCQIHAMMPMMQFSVAPWRVLDKEHLEICKKAAQLHSQLGTYLLEQAKHGATSGEPIVRPMDYAFPGQGFEDCTDQYMLGDKYLVAPMTTKGTMRNVSLPKGNWKDESGRRYKGGKTYTIDVPLERIPYFERVK